MKKIFAFISICRPVNASITFLTVLVSALISSAEIIPWNSIFLAAISGALGAASGNIVNDIYDINADKINKPLRPLPSGKISVKEAMTLYFLLSIFSLIFAYIVSLICLLIALAAVFLLFIYSKYLKKTILAGNITVALLTGLAFIYGGASVNEINYSLLPAGFAFLINLIREIVKDMEDIEGDKNTGVTTYAVKYGINSSIKIIFFLIFLLILLTFYPFLSKYYHIEFFIIVMVLVNPFLIYAVKLLSADPAKKNLKKISNILKFNMAAGLLAIYLGK